MKYGFYTTNFGFFGRAATIADLSAGAEASGWDGFFLWDHLQWPGMEPAVDPWVALTAAAVRTRRIAVGPMITPLPRRDLAKLARETVSLDHLSQGRLILGVGSGWATIPEFRAFGHERDLKIRGEMLDEGLSLLEKLWRGERVDHDGEHYTVSCEAFARPVQSPRIPVWVAGTWPYRKPFRRAAQWDGVFPIASNAMEGGTLSPAEFTDLVRLTKAYRTDTGPFDVVRVGVTADAGETEAISAYAKAGATWWLESRTPYGTTLERVRDRIRSGPPRISDGEQTP